MTDAEIAKVLSKHFGHKHKAEDITGSRELDNGATVATTVFGNKVTISPKGEVTVTTGPGTITAPEPVEAPEVETASPDEQDDLPPLEGTAEDDAPSTDEDDAGDDGLDGLTKKELQARAAEKGLDVSSRASKADLLSALRA